MRGFLDDDTCHFVIRALVLSKLDYGNGLLLGCCKADIQRLQRIQNWAAKLICKVLKRDHASPCLRQLHWLPVEERITFKVMVMDFKCLHQCVLDYLSNCISIRCHAKADLLSALDTTLLTEFNTIKTLKSAERKTFSYAAPRMWNRLPANMRESHSIVTFKSALKTHLYPPL